MKKRVLIQLMCGKENIIFTKLGLIYIKKTFTYWFIRTGSSLTAPPPRAVRVINPYECVCLKYIFQYVEGLIYLFLIIFNENTKDFPLQPTTK